MSLADHGEDRAPKLSTLALTDCVALTRIDVRARGDGGGGDDSLPEMRTVTVGSFRATVPGEEDADAAAEMIVDVDEIVALARRCPNLEALCAPASASSAAVDDDEGVVDEWSDALRGAAGTLREVCFQRPLTTTGLLLLVAGAAADTDGAMPALESIWAAARLVLPTKRHTTSDDARDDDGSDGEDAAPPTEADAVADDAAAIVAMCPSLRRLTFAHPGERKPPAANGDGASRERWDATEAFETARAARELTRGALLGRCRVAAEEGASRAVDIDVVVDFAGGTRRLRVRRGGRPDGRWTRNHPTRVRRGRASRGVLSRGECTRRARCVTRDDDDWKRARERYIRLEARARAGSGANVRRGTGTSRVGYVRRRGHLRLELRERHRDGREIRSRPRSRRTDRPPPGNPRR